VPSGSRRAREGLVWGCRWWWAQVRQPERTTAALCTELGLCPAAAMCRRARSIRERVSAAGSTLARWGAEPVGPELAVAAQGVGAAACGLETGQVREGEGFDGGCPPAGLDREAGEGGGGVVSGAVDSAVAAAGSVGGDDGELPDAGSDLAERSGSFGRALARRGSGGEGSRPPSAAEAEMLDAHAGGVVFARGDRRSGR
jgi:hypothetical protein